MTAAPIPTDLAPHPEGGRYREIFRSPARVTTAAGADRAAVTHIYFELRPGETSALHRVAGDEVWNLYRGALRLWVGKDAGALEPVELNAADDAFCFVVPAGLWQAAEPLGNGPALVGCTVAPGFEFADFELATGPDADALKADPRGLTRFLPG